MLPSLLMNRLHLLQMVLFVYCMNIDTHSHQKQHMLSYSTSFLSAFNEIKSELQTMEWEMANICSDYIEAFSDDFLIVSQKSHQLYISEIKNEESKLVSRLKLLLDQLEIFFENVLKTSMNSSMDIFMEFIQENEKNKSSFHIYQQKIFEQIKKEVGDVEAYIKEKEKLTSSIQSLKSQSGLYAPKINTRRNKSSFRDLSLKENRDKIFDSVENVLECKKYLCFLKQEEYIMKKVESSSKNIRNQKDVKPGALKDNIKELKMFFDYLFLRILNYKGKIEEIEHLIAEFQSPGLHTKVVYWVISTALRRK